MSTKKEDILKNSERLFYEYGFHGIGLKQIISESNVATMTLYNHFDSKIELIEEVLKKREERYWKYLDEYVANNKETPFIGVVEGHCKWLNDYSYKGDMFLRAIENFTDQNNNIEKIARGHKRRLFQYLEMLAKETDRERESELAIQITLLLEGATSMTTLIGSSKSNEHTLKMANVILNTNQIKK
ncbi:TetR/AcrR family transcriptional regulator [Mammaliicoccus lentus]|uniref:TetR/AcrR family transcriptional regulator n=1 Tax=Mammaliicoccus lentus TaxID=42858 RepID=UPI001B3391CB|nr:TetR/AcrR family transcriptional regulator [Mammaliicoccus lentus]